MFKKSIFTIAALFTALISLTSCDDTGKATSGQVNYLIGASSVSITDEDQDAWATIQNTYMSEVESVEGMTRTGNFFVMEGKYKDCDAAVLEACKNAENKLSDIKIQGYVNMMVRAVYYNNENESVIYEKAFGTAN